MRATNTGQWNSFWRKINCTPEEGWRHPSHCSGIPTETSGGKVYQYPRDQMKERWIATIQVGVDVSGGAEAAINAIRRLVTNLPDHHVVIKLDFSSAYYTIRRDTVLDTVADKLPELYRFIHAPLSGSPKFSYHTYIIESAEGSQQVDPLSGLEFCDAIHPTLEESSSRTKLVTWMIST